LEAELQTINRPDSQQHPVSIKLLLLVGARAMQISRTQNAGAAVILLVFYYAEKPPIGPTLYYVTTFSGAVWDDITGRNADELCKISCREDVAASNLVCGSRFSRTKQTLPNVNVGFIPLSFSFL
jgi:hypothetical protein